MAGPLHSHTSVSSLLREAVASPPGTQTAYNAYLHARAASPSLSQPSPVPSVVDEAEQQWREAAPARSTPPSGAHSQQHSSCPPVVPVLVALAAHVRHSPRTAAEALWARRVEELAPVPRTGGHTQPLGRSHTDAVLLSARLEARRLLAAAEAAHKEAAAAER